MFIIFHTLSVTCMICSNNFKPLYLPRSSASSFLLHKFSHTPHSVMWNCVLFHDCVYQVSCQLTFLYAYIPGGFQHVTSYSWGTYQQPHHSFMSCNASFTWNLSISEEGSWTGGTGSRLSISQSSFSFINRLQFSLQAFLISVSSIITFLCLCLTHYSLTLFLLLPESCLTSLEMCLLYGYRFCLSRILVPHSLLCTYSVFLALRLVASYISLQLRCVK